jgi:hypothetical protein
MPLGGPRLTTEEGKKNGVGGRVKERRKALNITQDALCARLAALTGGKWNPTEDEIYKLEAGKRICGDLEIKVLCKALYCTLLWLMGEVDSTDKEQTASGVRNSEI